MLVATLAHKSRFGFHPCDRATFLKLKELNKLAFKARHQAAAWKRWERKDPKHRVMRQKIRNNSGQVVGYQAPVPMVEPEVDAMFYDKVPLKNHYHEGIWHRELMIMKAKPCLQEIIDAYRIARHPVAEESLVEPLGISVEEIDEMSK